MERKTSTYNGLCFINYKKTSKYSNMGHGEDCEWVKRAYLYIKNQTRIDKVLYYYDAEYATLSETVGLREKTILKNVNKRLNGY